MINATCGNKSTESDTSTTSQCGQNSRHVKSPPASVCTCDIAIAKSSGFVAGLKPLDSKGNYSATSNNTKLVHWPLMGWPLHLVQRGGACVGCGPSQSPPRCTKCNSPPINGQCTVLLYDGPLLCGFNVAVKELIKWSSTDSSDNCLDVRWYRGWYTLLLSDIKSDNNYTRDQLFTHFTAISLKYQQYITKSIQIT